MLGDFRPFRCRVIKGDTVARVFLLGELDMYSVPVLERSTDDLFALAEPDRSRVVLDLTRLDFLDSSGLHAIMRLRRLAAERGLRLVVGPASPSVERVLRLTGVR